MNLVCYSLSTSTQSLSDDTSQQRSLLIPELISLLLTKLYSAQTPTILLHLATLFFHLSNSTIQGAELLLQCKGYQIISSFILSLPEGTSPELYVLLISTINTFCITNPRISILASQQLMPYFIEHIIPISLQADNPLLKQTLCFSFSILVKVSMDPNHTHPLINFFTPILEQYPYTMLNDAIVYLDILETLTQMATDSSFAELLIESLPLLTTINNIIEFGNCLFIQFILLLLLFIYFIRSLSHTLTLYPSLYKRSIYLVISLIFILLSPLHVLISSLNFFFLSLSLHLSSLLLQHTFTLHSLSQIPHLTIPSLNPLIPHFSLSHSKYILHYVLVGYFTH